MCRSDEERERQAGGRIEKEMKTRTRTLLRFIPSRFGIGRKEGSKVRQFQSHYLRCLGTFYISILARYEIRYFKLYYAYT